MFAKRPAVSNLSKPSAASAAGRGGGALAGVLAVAVGNPFIGAGGAAAVFALGLGALILVTANPNAGSPLVRMKLDDRVAQISHMQGPGAFNVDGLKPTDFVEGQPAPGGANQAVFTLPEGGSVGGGSALPAGAPAAIRNPGVALPAAPISGLTQPSPVGPLPVIATDGRTPYQAYSRPFASNGKPKVSLVLGGLGLNAAATRAAIERLPPAVTLSFVAYADGLQAWIDLARANGHEVLIEAPMEPLDAVANDPGPYALLSTANTGETTKRVEWVLARATGYFGVTNYLGGRFLASDAPMTAFMMALRQRGLAFVDDGTAARKSLPGLPRLSADTVVDADLTPESIQKQLILLESTASQHGQSMGSAFAYPVTLEIVNRWANGLAARGYQLAPASALARR